jgi:hypothetical protein
MKIFVAALLAASFAAVSPSFAEEKLSEEKVEQIMELLASMRCEMDEDDIEVDGDEIELDDVFCGGGQFDINLNEEMHVTGMRAE